MLKRVRDLSFKMTGEPGKRQHNRLRVVDADQRRLNRLALKEGVS